MSEHDKRICVVRGYESGDEVAQAKIDRVITASWEWPITHTLEQLRDTYSKPGFDLESVQYAWDGNQLVGFTRRWWTHTNVDGARTAFLLYPKTLDGYGGVREPLLDRLTQHEREIGTSAIQVWGCTMWPDSFEWLESQGFAECADLPRGYKIYMTYRVADRPIEIPTDWVYAVSTEEDLRGAAQLASIWYKQALQQCEERIRAMAAADNAVAHLAVRRNGHYTGACLIARNPIRPEVAAVYYVYAREYRSLRQLMSKAVAVCIEQGCQTLLDDLINEHRCFEPTYEDLGFAKTVEYAMYEKRIA
jgi:hypothetical protein